MQSRINAALLLDVVRALSAQHFFDAVGVAEVAAKREEPESKFSRWIHEGRAGDMHYLARRDEQGRLLREDMTRGIPWARSVLVFAANYRGDSPGSLDPHPQGAGWVARYAQTGDTAKLGSDYHDVLLARLREIEETLHSKLQLRGIEFQSRSFVDTGPFVERDVAVQAGLGWQAKNTCLIHPELGSWVFLAGIVTSLEIERADAPLDIVPDRCGSCTRCIEACPTGALDKPYWLDATRCIAYLTIEKREEIPHELRDGIGRHIFGCDICQDVCPWNERAARREKFSRDPALQPRADMVNPSLLALAEMTEDQLRAWFRRTPLRRAKFRGLRRNIAIAMGNAWLPEFRDVLERWAAQEDDAVLAEAAEWALKKYGRQKEKAGRQGRPAM